MSGVIPVKCPDCNGSGKRWGLIKCKNCNGKGYVEIIPGLP